MKRSDKVFLPQNNHVIFIVASPKHNIYKVSDRLTVCMSNRLIHDVTHFPHRNGMRTGLHILDSGMQGEPAELVDRILLCICVLTAVFYQRCAVQRRIFHNKAHIEIRIVGDPLDVWQLIQGRGKSFEQLLDESVDLHVQDGVILPNLKMAGEKEQCVYLNEKGRCSIHPFRPGICRLFPLGRFYENGSFRYFLQIKECSRENRTKQKIRKWIDMPEFGRYETFVADWHFFVRRLQDRLMQQSDMEAAQRINRYILQEFYFRGWDAEQNFYDQFSERLKKAQKVLA